jgi:transaldolase
LVAARDINAIEAGVMGCRISPADVLKKLPAIGSQSRAEPSLSAVKVFRDDALAALG